MIMDNTHKQPKTIFEQIVYGQEIINDNIVALADNLNVVDRKLDALLAIFTTPPVRQGASEPDASGAETMDQ